MAFDAREPEAPQPGQAFRPRSAPVGGNATKVSPKNRASRPVASGRAPGGCRRRTCRLTCCARTAVTRASHSDGTPATRRPRNARIGGPSTGSLAMRAVEGSDVGARPRASRPRRVARPSAPRRNPRDARRGVSRDWRRRVGPPARPRGARRARPARGVGTRPRRIGRRPRESACSARPSARASTDAAVSG